MKRIAAAERHQNVATAEGRGKDLSWKTYFAGCALSRLHSQPLIFLNRHRGGGHPPTPATPPCVRVRTRRFETVTLHSSTKVGSPRDLKYALESPTVRALVRARCQGPRPLLAVLRASRGETPSFKRAARRRRGVFHCRHKAARSRNRTQRVR